MKEPTNRSHPRPHIHVTSPASIQVAFIPYHLTWVSYLHAHWVRCLDAHWVRWLRVAFPTKSRPLWYTTKVFPLWETQRAGCTLGEVPRCQLGKVPQCTLCEIFGCMLSWVAGCKLVWVPACKMPLPIWLCFDSGCLQRVRRILAAGFKVIFSFC